MPIDMKKHIVETAKQLLYQQKKKKLTVKDIVDACGITRQTFYYHFEDIPDLIRWSLNYEFQMIAQQGVQEYDLETVIGKFLQTVLEKRPYVEKILETNYGETVERLMMNGMKEYLVQMIDEKHLFQQCSRTEVKIIVNCYAYALKGIVIEWDTLNLDIETAVHQIHRLFTGKMPLEEKMKHKIVDKKTEV